jgi:putative transposase
VTSAFEQARRREQAEQVAYWRYQLIRDAADPGLSPRARGRLVRTLAATVHKGPFGEQTQISRQSLDRWIRAWRRGGFTALQPPPRQVTPRTPTEVLDLAAALKREQPERTAAQVARILRAHSGWSPSERTLLRHFDRLELRTRPDGQPPQVFGRFEAEAPNVRWVGDALHGPKIAGRKTYLTVTWNLADRSKVTDCSGPSRPVGALSCGQRALGGEVAGAEPARSGVRVAAGVG